MPKIVLVTGATGKIASYAIPQLLGRGLQVRAYVHNAAKAEKLKKNGVELIEGEFSDSAKLDRAAEGADTIISITPMGKVADTSAAHITRAAKHAGTKHLLRVSAIGAAPDAPTGNGKLHAMTDSEIMASGIPYTILRPNYYMQNVLGSIPTIQQQGKIYSGTGSGKIGMIDVRDVADCLVSLCADGGHLGQVYTLTGDASISYYDIARMIGDGLGKPVEFVPVPIEAVGEMVRNFGMDPWAAQVTMDYSKAYSQGWGDLVTDSVEKIAGHKPRSFQQFFDEVMSRALKG